MCFFSVLVNVIPHNASISPFSDISKYQEILKEYQTYKTFLMAVGPMEWREEQKRKREDRRATKQRERENTNIFCLPSSVKGMGV